MQVNIKKDNLANVMKFNISTIFLSIILSASIVAWKNSDRKILPVDKLISIGKISLFTSQDDSEQRNQGWQISESKNLSVKKEELK